MDALLTHENADFDAVAALLGAKKIYPAARAVLPRRLNRNVRDFLALYADALPFTRADEVQTPRRGVSLRDILVVDTQSFPTARGMDQNTRVHFFDHHTRARELKPGDTFAGGDAGATTTLLVEALREKNIALTPIEATLLMLGIYEDTGALLYGTTTPRDVRAAAFLLEQNAMLDTVREFLQHPLTDDQRALYQTLLEQTQTLEIAGHSIAIAAARAKKFTQEIASLAHQLRAVHDPAALFVIVQMDDHIQLVARSDRDAIDVAEIARAFGGRGHPRASAALIKGMTLPRAKTTLIKLLKSTIKPSLTVRALMSTGAQTLEPDATVAQAAEMMRRYGHEGFPVARRGKLVGVLTRREIERALHHHLQNKPVKNFMRAPSAVAPEDSLEKLRAVMIEADVGQVPVVEKKKIIGIVTRTDLLKHAAAPAAQTKNLSARLEKNLPPELGALLRAASETARVLGCSLYLVGGFVRDLLLNQPDTFASLSASLDLDLVVEGDAIALAESLQKKFGGRVHAHARFGTAQWMLQGATHFGSASHLLGHLDFATARREFYAHPSALPEVERSSIKQDLLRRDFTINTLALSLDPNRFGQLLDPFGGEADLQRGIIRVLHNLSFIEDPTRIMRAARFEQRFGFQIEARTAELIGDALEILHRVSGARVRGELDLIFRERAPEKSMARLHDLGALKEIFPRLAFTAWHAEKFRALTDAERQPIYFLGLLAYNWNAADAAAFAKRLALSNDAAATLADLISLRAHLPRLAAPELAPSALAQGLDKFSDDALRIAAGATDDARARERIQDYRARLKHIAPELGGNDLKRLGLPPGPVYREILSRLRDARLDGKIATREEEEALVVEWSNSQVVRLVK